MCPPRANSIRQACMRRRIRIKSRAGQVYYWLLDLQNSKQETATIFPPLHLLASKIAAVTYSTEDIGFESCHLSLNLCISHNLSSGPLWNIDRWVNDVTQKTERYKEYKSLQHIQKLFGTTLLSLSIISVSKTVV